MTLHTEHFPSEPNSKREGHFEGAETLSVQSRVFAVAASAEPQARSPKHAAIKPRSMRRVAHDTELNSQSIHYLSQRAELNSQSTSAALRTARPAMTGRESYFGNRGGGTRGFGLGAKRGGPTLQKFAIPTRFLTQSEL
jgi:hypothetical protein